jgi:DNA-binding MarR family transcriptional regulator
VAAVGAEEGIADVEHALERLFRLTVSRSIHNRQSTAVGANITRAGYAVLRVVEEAGELSLGEVARLCNMDPAAVGRQVRALEEEGFVARVADADDARVVLVRLTEQGRDVYRRIVDVRRIHMAEVLSAWSAKDRANLATLVERLVDDLKSVPFRPATTKGRANADA